MVDEHGGFDGERKGGVAPVGPAGPVGGLGDGDGLGQAVIGEFHLQVHRGGDGEVGGGLACGGLGPDASGDVTGEEVFVGDGGGGVERLEGGDEGDGKAFVEGGVERDGFGRGFGRGKEARFRRCGCGEEEEDERTHGGGWQSGARVHKRGIAPSLLRERGAHAHSAGRG